MTHDATDNDHIDVDDGSLSPRRREAIQRYLHHRPTNQEFPCTNYSAGSSSEQNIEAEYKQAAKRIEDVSCVLENRLYLSSAHGARNKQLLKQLSITVVINCTDDETNEFFKNDTDYQPQYFTYTLHDEETDDLFLIEHTMNHSCDIIHNAVQSGGCVLVHCVAGISRSPTLVLYYLLMHHQTTLRQGLLDLISVRNFVAPNLRYMATLIQHEQKILKKSTLSLEEYILHYMGLISMDEMQCNEMKERQERFLEIIQPVVQFCADDHGELAYRLINLEIPLHL